MQNQNENKTEATKSHSVPKCTVCGYIGEWENERLFHPLAYVPTIIMFLCLFAFFGTDNGGWLAAAAIICIVFVLPYGFGRIVKKKVRMCAKCKSVEKFTFLY